MALFANGLDTSFNNPCVYFTSCIIRKTFERYYPIFYVKETGEGRGRGMTIGRAGKMNEKEISEKRVMKMNLLTL